MTQPMTLIPNLNSEGNSVNLQPSLETSLETREALSAQSSPVAAPISRPFASPRNAGIVVGGSVLVALCAHGSIPLYFTPVPLSLAPFAVLLMGLLLSPRLAAATLGAYLVEGAMGLPVFAPNPLIPGGLAHLLGPTGGYLMAYPLAAPLISFIWRRIRPSHGREFRTATLSAAAGSLVILASGALWLDLLTHASAWSILTLAVSPFLPGDALKVIVAASIAAGLQRLRHQQN
jgi:biotin transport system substrate-specific component